MNTDLNSFQEAELNNLFEKLLVEKSNIKDNEPTNEAQDKLEAVQKLPVSEQEKALDKMLRESFQDLDSGFSESEFMEENEEESEIIGGPLDDSSFAPSAATNIAGNQVRRKRYFLPSNSDSFQCRRADPVLVIYNEKENQESWDAIKSTSIN